MSLVSIISQIAGGYDNSGITPPSPPTFTELNRAVVVCDGNSLTQGGYGTPPTSYPNKLFSDPFFRERSIQILSFGAGGQQTSAMIADAATQIDILISDRHENILVFWEVGNDIVFNENVNAAIDRAKTYLQARKAAGWKTIALTVTPRDFTESISPAYSTLINNYYLAANEQIRTLSSTYVDAICDVAADSRLSTVTLDYYHTDKIHLKEAGNIVIAELVRETIKSLY